MQPKRPIALIVDQLVPLQRQRSIIVKSRNMQSNRLQAIVAGTLGYCTTMTKEERAKKFIEASAKIKAIEEEGADHPLKPIVLTTLIGINAFEAQKDAIEKNMLQYAKKLPIKAWVEKPEQRGFGLLFLAIVIGETGDLANYANPAKVWKRLGCAPLIFNGKTAMGATWRRGKEGKLPSEEWEKFGYSPRRRSIAYLIGEGLMKQNHSIYRARYDEAKATFQAAHPDYKKLRCHLHGMLLATKLFLKMLWIEWNDHPAHRGL
jgi:hypothetical protein